ncbi:hypothetical protein AURDEDRAFT_174638 [Auricularia subglabra TFB-10046 SS5]|uniref:F-box domain-containing protein n=1 Tax=Auricularia subglabra (strain TFB-10046 / SS5) TaxID=717982 RepID=J0CYE5_AURST|nr:hypothetical protein AURDEDRAFT_174638 [Auricularia subglabra TFB-10046 SS5]
MSSFSIPADVIQCVFDCLDLTNICSCAHVSRYWRKLARAYPTFWQTLFLTDDSLSLGEAAFFVDQLCARSEPDSTFSLFLRCTSFCPIIFDHVLPHLCANIHRAKELSLVLTPSSLNAFLPLFSHHAPYLSILRVMIHEATVSMPRLNALFQCHTSSALRRVLLFDLALSDDIPPLSHTVDALQGVYIRIPAELPRALKWIPRCRRLDPLTINGLFLPRPSFLILNSVSSLVVYDEDWLTFSRTVHIPTLIIRYSNPSPHGVRSIVPIDGPICACVISTQHSDSSSSGNCGQAAVVTQDGKDIRYFDYLDAEYTSSPTFLTAILPASRLVTLAVSLEPVFRCLCEMKNSFPSLRMLILGIYALPSEEDLPSWGHIECLRLSAVTLQRDGILPVCISATSMERFVTRTLVYTGTSAPRVVLRGVHITGEARDISGVSSVVLRGVRPWFACTPEDSQRETSAVESVLNLPRMPWLESDEPTAW